MSWKGLYLSQPARLSLQQKQVLIEQADQTCRVPLEDMAFIVLDSQQVTLTAALLAACAEHGCLVMTTDERHLPNGLLHSFHAYHRQSESLQLQLNLSEPRKKRLWQRIIQAKIERQADCLYLLGAGTAAQRVRLLAQKVRSGDPDNVEGQAARLYWAGMNPRIKRDSEGGDRLNALLNYAYALLRSALAQALCAAGFLPCLGIHHRNMQNPFNLADDLIEPCRPLADFYVIHHWHKSRRADSLSPADKQHLLALFYTQAAWTDGEQTLLLALRRYAEQFRPYCAGQLQAFACPAFGAQPTAPST